MTPEQIAKLTELIKTWDGEAIFNHNSEKDLAVYISERLFVHVNIEKLSPLIMEGEIKVNENILQK